MLAERIALSMLLRGWPTGPRPCPVPDGRPWQRADQQQEKVVLGMNRLEDLTCQMEMHDERNEVLAP
jgi:hypothetical protein